MSNIFVNPYANQGSMSWAIQNCFLYMTSGTGGDLSTEDATGGVLAAAEGLQLTYQRAISQRYPISGKKPIKLVGVPQGQGTISAILGPYSGVQEFLKKFGATCKPFNLRISQKKAGSQEEECSENTTSHIITLTGCLGTAVSYTISVQDNLAIAQGQFAFMFDNMEWDSEG